MNIQAIFTSLADIPQSAGNVCDILDSARKRSEIEIQGRKDPTANIWWNDNCLRDYKRRKAAWKQLVHNQSPSNWNNYKYIAASFKRTVTKVKDEYVCHFEFFSKSHK